MDSDSDVLRIDLDTADRDWFAAHPSAEWRKRRFIPAESPSTAQMRPGVTHTAVFRRRDGSLVRRYFRAGGE